MGEKRLNFVLIEDDEIAVLNIRSVLKRGLSIHPMWVASDGRAGLALLRGPEVPRERRLVLLDLYMPRMNGFEFLRELRADPQLRLTPVVVLTTSDDPRDRLEAYQLDVASVLVKPARLGDFVELMSALVRYWTLVEMPPTATKAPYSESLMSRS